MRIVLEWTVENGPKLTKKKPMTENMVGECVCSMCIEFDLSHNVQFYLIRTFLCGLSKTHQNGSVDAEGSMRFR